MKNTAEAGGFLVKQKGRAGGGRKKKPQPASREGTPDDMAGSPAADAEAAPEGQGHPSPSLSPATSPAVKGGRTGNPFEEEEREAVLTHSDRTTCLLSCEVTYFLLLTAYRVFEPRTESLGFTLLSQPHKQPCLLCTAQLMFGCCLASLSKTQVLEAQPRNHSLQVLTVV